PLAAGPTAGVTPSPNTFRDRRNAIERDAPAPPDLARLGAVAQNRPIRQGGSLNANVIISCAVTGAGDTVGKHPAIPVTPRQIADSAIEAAKAGAAVAQMHEGDPQTGQRAR